MPYVELIGSGFSTTKVINDPLGFREGVTRYKIPEYESSLNITPRINPWANFDRYYSVYLQYEKDVEYQYVFFVRPQLNIVKGIPEPPPSINFGTVEAMYRILSPELTDQANNNPTISWVANTHGEIIYNLIKGGYNHHFMPYLTGRVESLSIPDFAINTYSITQPVTGYNLPLAGNAIESTTGGDISITFRDDGYHRILNMFRVWIEYMHCVTTGLMDPVRHQDSKNNGPIANNYLDYMGSIYSICTRADGSEIVWFDKFTGVIPTEVPDGNMSFNRGGATESNIQIPFKFFHHRACDNAIIMDFNYNAANGKPLKNGRIATTYAIHNKKLGLNVASEVAGNGMVNHPYIRYDHKLQKYFLEWIY